MRNTPDPSIHQARERQMIEHVERLLADSRLIIDTTAGRKPVTSFTVTVEKSDRGDDLKRAMSAKGLPDRDLQNRMPVGQTLTATLAAKKWLVMSAMAGRIHVACISPTDDLLTGKSPAPISLASTRQYLTKIPASDGPTTVVLVSTSGFEIGAREAAARTADRTVILIEPNDAGGWNAYGPVETKALVDLFDPEAEEAKRHRINYLIEANRSELAQGGFSADKLCAMTQLPLSFVENEVRSYAKSNPGLSAKRLDGRLVLYREGSLPPVQTGGSSMPMIDRIKSLFSRKGETEKKIAYLSERKAALSQQRDRVQEDLTGLEARDRELQSQFQQGDNPLAKRRVTTQLVQLRKDIERRQQMLSMVSQQMNIVGTHLHNLELMQQGQSAKLPAGEEIAADAAKAEEVLAQLQADAELADSLGASAPAGMTSEEQALYQQLERQTGDKSEESASQQPAKPDSAKRRAEPEAG